MNGIGDIIRSEWNKAREGIIRSLILKNNSPSMGASDLELVRNNAAHPENFFHYNLRSTESVSPYYPLLDSLFSLIASREAGDIESVVSSAGIYPLHRRIFIDAYSRRPIVRDEELIDEELSFERLEMKHSILNLFNYLTEGKPFLILIENIQNMSDSTLEMLDFFHQNSRRASGLFVMTYIPDQVSVFEKREYLAKIIETGGGERQYELETGIDSPGVKPERKKGGTSDIVKRIDECESLLRFFNLPECKTLALEIYEQIEKESEKAYEEHKLRLLVILGDVFKYLGDSGGGLFYYNLLIDNARKFGHNGYILKAMRCIASIYIVRGNNEEARHEVSTGIKFAEQYGSDEERFYLYFDLYMIYQQEHRIVYMRNAADTVFSFAGRVDKPNHFAMVYLVDIYDPDQEFRLNKNISRGLSILRKIKNRFRLAKYHHQVGAMRIYTGSHKEGLKDLKKARKIFYQLGEFKFAQKINNSLGYYYFIRGLYADSVKTFFKALDLVSRDKDFYEATITVFNIAFLFFYIFEYRLALEYFEYLISMMKSLELRFIPYHPIEEVYLFCAIILLKLGSAGEAEYYFKLSRKRITSSNTRLEDWAEPRLWVKYYLGLRHGEDSYFAGIIKTLEQPRSNVYFITVAPHLYLEYARFIRDKLGDPERAAAVIERGLEVCRMNDRHPFDRYLLRELNRDIRIPPMTVASGKTEMLSSMINTIEYDRNQNKIHSLIDRIHFLNTFQAMIDGLRSREAILRKSFTLITENLIVERSFVVFVSAQGEMIFDSSIDKDSEEKVRSMMRVLLRYPSYFCEEVVEEPELKVVNPFGFHSVASFVIDESIRGKHFFLYATLSVERRIGPEDYQILSLLSKQIVFALEKNNLYEELENERNDLLHRNKIIDNELEMAKKIQLNMIPRHSPRPGIAYFYLPMEQLGGDFFDFIQIGPDRIGVFISDVSGHGVPAAFVTSMIKSFILQTTLHDDPAQMLQQLNQSLFNQTAGLFITAFYGIIDFSGLTLRFANAGHNMPFFLRKEKGEVTLTQIPSYHNGMPIGVFSTQEMADIKREFENQQIALAKDDKLIFYTDGLTEAINIMSPDSAEQKIDYENTRLTETLISGWGLDSNAFLEKIFADLVEFRGSENFDDDICIICIHV
ncbi:MAG: hypothetical protein A2Y33_09215 [Spirochaetes bacterium GWF1_51_8]|nr:MAG: hypothetical protein A2Y33_09215 [Spirochaetes bacterium GWF1_51_8]